MLPSHRAPAPNEAATEANEGSPQAGGAGIPSLCRWAQSFHPTTIWLEPDLMRRVTRNTNT